MIASNELPGVPRSSGDRRVSVTSSSELLRWGDEGGKEKKADELDLSFGSTERRHDFKVLSQVRTSRDPLFDGSMKELICCAVWTYS